MENEQHPDPRATELSGFLDHQIDLFLEGHFPNEYAERGEPYGKLRNILRVLLRDFLADPSVQTIDPLPADLLRSVLATLL